MRKINIRDSRSIISYGKAKNIRIERGRTSRTRKRIPLIRKALFSYALSRSFSKSRWPFGYENKCTDENEFRIREYMDKVVQGRGSNRSEN